MQNLYRKVLASIYVVDAMYFVQYGKVYWKLFKSLYSKSIGEQIFGYSVAHQ